MKIRCISVVALILAAGCSVTRPPEAFPDLLSDNAKPGPDNCTLRETDHCFVSSVDDHYITQYDINPTAPATYRQLVLPPGSHTIAVFYRQQRNFETITAGPRFIILNAQPGHTYNLCANTNGADVPFADTLPTANWRPTLTDAETHTQVAIARTNDR
ncbi:MAG TPA: hypothetical protein VFE58_04465 [Tepidisphaeraceae bacterium]|jgi:hypothetical protein|nr:hypothetical protein [Tepidisphaeraceae bacterium]